MHGFLKCDASSINVVAVAVFISEENFSCGMESDQITYAWKEENKPSNVYKIQILDNHTTGNINPSRRGINDGVEEESYLNGSSGGASKEDEIGLCFSARIISIYSMEDGSSSCTPSVKSSSKTRQKGSPVSNENKNNGRKLKKQGTVASAANRTKSDCRMSKDVVKPSEKPKPSVCKEITSKADGSTIQCNSSSNIRGGPPKTHSTPKSLSDRLPGTSSVLTRSAQRSSKEMTTISHLRKFSVDNRICDGFGQRSLGLSGHHILPKSRESESQRPKVV
ncbi:hypothetical protein NC653_031343 [Populus alba x Populus x berolinensis]|uniref:Uncharacterized protein n=2 Tax=Populus TaxID=3689 RepID=A0A4U5QZ02_POPAL|nr:hypothetical protein NC653_031343 [Populus alba x Populus x berolinensis]TKS15819.1 hypothetical protein D5086_0000030650 [Populus alba]